MAKIANGLGFVDSIVSYQQGWHEPLKVAGGLFTIFLVAELVVRWLIAIVQKRYYRWFFFPFVHWYEVLGCAPQLRALRLLRVGARDEVEAQLPGGTVRFVIIDVQYEPA